MEGRDIIGRAKTGSGKTLAFALPIVDSLLKVPLFNTYIYLYLFFYIYLFIYLYIPVYLFIYTCLFIYIYLFIYLY